MCRLHKHILSSLLDDSNFASPKISIRFYLLNTSWKGMDSQGLAFHIVDVFAESRYTGNQLAVVKSAKSLTSSRMQKIAREFNFSETTFVSSEKQRVDNPFSVRIFTPKHELPFAGHPTLGTAWVIQQYLLKKRVPIITLSLKVGKIPVTFHYKNDEPDILWMKQDEPEFGSKAFDPESLSRVLGIKTGEIDHRYPIQDVSTGVPFIIVPLKTLKTLKRCLVDSRLYFSLVSKTRAKSILVFCPEAYEKKSDLGVRVFPEYYGIREDPATGSANGCLAAYLSRYRYFGKSDIEKTVDQGYEIGRPSKLMLKASSKGETIIVSVGGRVANVAEGTLVV